MWLAGCGTSSVCIPSYQATQDEHLCYRFVAFSGEGNTLLFQSCVRALAAAEGWNARAVETKRDYCIMGCVHKSCPFFVRLRTTKGNLVVTKYKHIHNCLGRVAEGKRSSAGNHELLVDTINSSMVVDQSSSAKAIKRQLKHSTGLDPSNSAVYKAKAAAINSAIGDEIDSFKRLPAYVKALVDVDKDTRAVLELDNGKFHRMFVSPGACSKAWRHARQWLAVDATFMKTKHQLRLHLAAAMDGTGSLILLAWALSPGESQDNWEWFMLNLRQSLQDLGASSATIVSDRNAGLLNAIETILPNANSVYCCFHIAKNLKDYRFSAAAGRVFWQMVYAPTKSKFDGYMDTLVRLDKDAADYVKGIDATKWATYAVPGRRFGHVTSNLAEVANAMLLDARELPPLQCMDHIYWHQMERFFSRRIEAINCDSPIVPNEYSRLQTINQDARRMTAVCSDDKNGWVTSIDGTQYVVKLPVSPTDVGSCGCRQYQVFLRPCRHAVALMQKIKVSVAPYYHSYYTVDNWRAMYSNTLPSISTTNLAMKPVTPPSFKRKVGRPQKERKEVGHTSTAKHCSVCGRDDHRRKDCSVSWEA